MNITLQSRVQLSRSNFYSRATYWYYKYKSRYEGVDGRVDDLIKHIKRNRNFSVAK